MRSKNNLRTMLNILCKYRNGLNMCHLNAQSLRCKIDEFRHTFINSSVHVIFVSETWFDLNVDDCVYKVNGYELLRADRVGHGGGVAIYIKSNIKNKIISRSVVESPIEHIFVELLINNSKILVGCIYRPHKRIDYSELLNSIRNTSLPYDHIVFAGDLNNDFLKEFALINDMHSIGLQSINLSTPTHFTNSSNTLLDIFLTSNKYLVTHYDQLTAPAFSKHDLIFMSYDLSPSTHAENFTYRDFYNIDINLLNYEFDLVNWDCIYHMTNVNEQIHFLQSNINNIFNRTIPLKTKVKRHNETPWFTSEIQNLISKRDLVFKKWKRYEINLFHNEFVIL